MKKPLSILIGLLTLYLIFYSCGKDDTTNEPQTGSQSGKITLTIEWPPRSEGAAKVMEKIPASANSIQIKINQGATILTDCIDNPNANTTTAISGGGSHTCARLSDSTVLCWGDNSSGQLGDGTTNNSSTPVKVSGISTATAVSAGGNHTCARLSDSTIMCWGSNSSGQLGNGTLTNSSTPVLVTGITTATSVSAGGSHTCAVLSNNTVSCWGLNSFGQLGNNSTTNSSTPVSIGQIESNRTTDAVVAGGNHTCAIADSRDVWCWGLNSSGQLGVGDTTDRHTPTQITSGGFQSSSISLGSSHTCAFDGNGTGPIGIRCWGSDSSGQLGDDAALANKSTPVAVSGITTAMSIGAGGSHTCAPLQNGTVRCWGSDSSGQLGDDAALANKSTPVQVSGITTANQTVPITAGGSHTCALLSDAKTIKCWGENSSGQLGNNGAPTDSPTPVDVSGTVSVTATYYPIPTGSTTVIAKAFNTIGCTGTCITAAASASFAVQENQTSSVTLTLPDPPDTTACTL